MTTGVSSRQGFSELFCSPRPGLQSDEAEGEDVSDDDFMNGPVAARQRSAEGSHRVQQTEAKVGLVPVMNGIDASLRAARFHLFLPSTAIENMKNEQKSASIVSPLFTAFCVSLKFCLCLKF